MSVARVTPLETQPKVKRQLSRSMTQSLGGVEGKSVSWKVMQSMDVRKSRGQRNWERKIMGDARPGFIDVDVGYSQERASIFSFCFQFPDVICRYHGSVVPTIVIEILCCTGLGVVASIYWKDEDDLSPIGHQIVGTLLAFLIVFRSNIAWKMYLAGYTSITTLRTHLINVANVVIAPMLAKCRNPGPGKQPTPLPEEAHELVRMLKLFFFLSIEHLRSTEGTGAWEWAQTIAYSYALPHEIKEFNREYGVFQANSTRTDVQWRHDEYEAKRMPYHARPAQSNGWLDGRKKIGEQNVKQAMAWQLGGKEPPKPKIPKSAWRTDKEIDSIGLGGQYADKGNSYDPTRGKPLKVLLWLQVLLSKCETKAAKGAEEGGYMKMAGINQVNALGTHFFKMYQVDSLVLPLPWNQLLKIFLLSWTFTLPFAIAAEVGWYNAPIMLLISTAFFGLDQVGAMLEQPFGTEAADISLLHIGAEVADDLDSLLRSAELIADSYAEAVGAEPTHTRTFVLKRGKTNLEEKMDDEEEEEEEEDDAADDAADDGDDGGDDGGD